MNAVSRYSCADPLRSSHFVITWGERREEEGKKGGGGKEGRRRERREEGGKKGGGGKGKKREMKGHFKGLIHMQSYKIKYTRCILTLAS